jgi:hypothetical protein
MNNMAINVPPRIVPVDVRLLLVGDSHMRDMDFFVQAIRPTYSTFTVCIPSSIDDIMTAYRSKFGNITTFDPEYCLLHMGHNELAYHPAHNVSPRQSRDVIRRTMAVAREIQTDFPTARIITSATFPRTTAYYSHLNPKEIRIYNKTAKRHGQRIRAASSPLNYESSMNNPLWKHISKYEEDPKYYRTDGLHLNPVGMLTIAKCWMEQI